MQIELTALEIEKRKNETMVLLGEEYGYRKWFWFPLMEPDELIQWWQEMETVKPYFFKPIALPGELIQATEKAHFDLYRKLGQNEQHFSGHIHENNDSYLRSPSGKTFKHKGFEND